MALATWVRCAATRNKNGKRPPPFQLSDRKNDGTDNVGQLCGQDKNLSQISSYNQEEQVMGLIPHTITC